MLKTCEFTTELDGDGPSCAMQLRLSLDMQEQWGFVRHITEFPSLVIEIVSTGRFRLHCYLSFYGVSFVVSINDETGNS